MADLLGGPHRLDDRVAVVTGAGRGIGRAHALALAALGAAVVVNDPGGSLDGSPGGGGRGPAAEVVAEIEAAGGRAVADTTPVGDFAGADAILAGALDAFGRLDVLVNNAGILRPRTIVGMTPEDWGDVLRVHLDGTLAMTHAAAGHWRAAAKAGETRHARLVNTTSASGLFGAGQANYAAAKAAIVAVTLIAAAELSRYGVTANAVAPVALTRMSTGYTDEANGAEHVARLVCWLCSDAAAQVTGRVLTVAGGHVSVVEPAHVGPGADASGEWSLSELDTVVPALLERAAPAVDLFGYRPGQAHPPALRDSRIDRRDG